MIHIYTEVGLRNRRERMNFLASIKEEYKNVWLNILLQNQWIQVAF